MRVPREWCCAELRASALLVREHGGPRDAAAELELFDDCSGWARGRVEQQAYEQMPQQPTALGGTPRSVWGELADENPVGGGLPGQGAEHGHGLPVGCRSGSVRPTGGAVVVGLDERSQVTHMYPAIGEQLADPGFSERGQQQVLGADPVGPELLGLLCRPQ